MDPVEAAMWQRMPVLEPGAVLCSEHWHHYLRQLPARAMAVFMMRLFNQLCADEGFAKAIGGWRPPPEVWAWPDDWTEGNTVMRQEPFAPWCCYLGQARRDAAWQDTPFTGLPKEAN